MSTDIELNSRHRDSRPAIVANDQRSSKPASVAPPEPTQDECDLRRFGREAKLKRHMSFWATIAMTCLITATWEHALFSVHTMFIGFGVVATLTAFSVGWMGAVFMVLVLAEMASMIPLAGGPYNWVYAFAPSCCSKSLSYVVAWIAMFGWTLTAQNKDYVVQHWHIALFIIGLVILIFLIYALLHNLYPKMYSVAFLLVHVGGYLALVVTLICRAPKVDAEPSTLGKFDHLSFFFYVIATMQSGLTKFDAPAHVAEEVKNASVKVPVAMILSVLFNGIQGLVVLVIARFYVDVHRGAELSDHRPQQPIVIAIGFALDRKLSVPGTIALSSTMAIGNILSAFISIFALSRCLWAMARDRGIPGHRWLSRVHPDTGVPVGALAVACLFSILLSVIESFSDVTYQTLFVAYQTFCFASFIIPVSFLLWRRLVNPASAFPWGRFHLGYLGIPLYVLSLLFATGMFFLSLLRTHDNVENSQAAMNSNGVIFGGAVILASLDYYFRARLTFKGAIREIPIEGVEFMNRIFGRA